MEGRKIDKYYNCINEWNDIFSKAVFKIPSTKSSGNEELDKGIEWLCDGTKSILDFGCGNGKMLFLCALNGTEYHIGIDFSEKAIENAKALSSEMIQGEYKFIKGSIEALEGISDSSVDAIILSNVIDNLYPEDGEELINQVKRILRIGGKVLVKLNPYIKSEEIEEMNIKVIKDNLLDDGLILLNRTTEEWESFFNRSFNISAYKEIYYLEFKQSNRMFLLTREL